MIRKIKQSDKNVLKEMLNNIPTFTGDEVSVAMELINIAVTITKQTDYNIFVYEEKNNILGYHCTGKRSLTDAVYDLYWIVVDINYQGKGIGKKLLQHALNFVNEQKGRWLLIETSSMDNYQKTRNFYTQNNFEEISKIQDFYKVNDDLIIYGKKFNNI